ncbi:LysR family transcriptional regulator [Corallococcus carmarthensis]|uniref:LysR family transcriptional regulator n=1 Tax=Corallococcus carmarthensis TaxID=2316728 RepID=A0A3A8KFD6_9BACT|nr:LysR family transcriptional regulator [Corallococcus carmarthensis]NOK16807.1 LysR family transcriptional regulator [Corallococcus carmarthensis]RKH06670.1 LysR family transcriptional regulator [Corallococcus carmarthensis]
MDLEELRAFIDVAETGSFLAAADALGVSRTTLRRRVEALEARAGVPLLKSTRTGIVLTEAGEVLAQRGRIMMQETSALLASIREVGQAPSGTLRVVLPVGLPPHLLAPLFGLLRTAHPLLRVHASFSDNPLIEPLDNVDLAVHFGEDVPKGPWLSQVMLRVPEGLVASKAYLERRGVPRAVEDLRDHELFSWQAPGADARLWPLRRGPSFRVEPALISADIHLIRTCCIAGQGIGWVPSVDLADPGEAGDVLVPVLPDVVGRERPLRVSVPEALCEIPKIKLVLAHIQRFLEPL